MKKLILLPIVLLVAVGNPWLAGYYTVSDRLQQADVIVPLRGPDGQERKRLDEAARLVREGQAPILLVSLSGAPYYGRSKRELVEAYLMDSGFPKDKLKFCENTADSTWEEAAALRVCLSAMTADRVFIVTSDYHTRRARLLFRETMKEDSVVVWAHPVDDEEIWGTSWWQRRRWAKTFALESLSWAANAGELLIARLRSRKSGEPDSSSE